MSKKYLFVFAIFFSLNIFAEKECGNHTKWNYCKKNFVPAATKVMFLM